MRVVWLLVLLALAAPAQARLVIDDAAGDVHANGADPAAAPEPMGIDIVQGVFDFGPDGVMVAITVDDMEAIDNGAPWAGTSTEYRARWEQAGFRDGDWTVRVFYSGDWRNMVEGPCTDGNDRDGCAGADRDIHDDLPMQVDAANETVRLLIPAELLPEVNVTWSDFDIYTSAAKVYPVFFVDEAVDVTGHQIVWPSLEVTTPFADSRNDTAGPEDADSGRDGLPDKDAPFAQLAAIVGITLVAVALERRRR